MTQDQDQDHSDYEEVSQEETPTVLLIVPDQLRRQTIEGLLKKEYTSNDAQFSWELDNRYYSVTLSVNVLNSDKQHEAQELSRSCGAVIIVFDGTEERFKKDVEPWSSFLEQVDPSVSLCMAAKTSEKPAEGLESLYSKYNSWCIDHGVEFVPSHTFDSAQDSGEEETYGVERIGVDRIVEALQSNVWPGMVYKSQSRPTESRTAENFGSEDHDIMAALTTTLQSVQTAPQEAPIPSQKNETSRDTEAHARAAALLRDLNELNDGENVEENSKEMKQLESFEKAMLQLDQMRVRAQGLPDSDRRDLAAKIAMSFLSEMGDSEEDDE